jgi:hypothetical protein
LDAVEKTCETLVFSGLPPQGQFPADFVIIPELAYSTEYKKNYNPDDVAETIVKTIRNRFNGPCDVLHVHNPTLAKNKQFLDIIKSLQKRGVNLLLQIHDFAEDGRPLNYYSDEYPSDCHYGVINQRDYEILLDVGLKKEGLHRLVNPVNPRRFRPQSERVNSLALYPIRAIRRKNIGEAILLSLFFRQRQSLAITLPPNSPVDVKSYEGWKTFVKERKFNVEFDTGLTCDFETLMLSAQLVITTSITEGFGFSFLEPWLFGKLLWGRKLPEICRDFEMNGIQLNHLYNRLNVPTDWIGLRRFRQRWTAFVLKACALFSLPMTKSNMRKAYDAITSDGIIDYGLLDESAQKQVILKLISDKKHAGKLERINPFLADPGVIPNPKELVETNGRAIREFYAPAIYRQKMLDLYQKVSTTPVRQKIDKTGLAEAFLNLKRFSLLKWGEYTE